MVRIMLITLKWLVRAVQFLFPWIVRLMVLAVELMLGAFLAWWRGVPNQIEFTADAWVLRLNAAGIIIDYNNILHLVISILAFVTIVVGWILQAYVTVIICGLIFGR